MFQVQGFAGVLRGLAMMVLSLSVLHGQAWGIGLNDISTWYGSGTSETGFAIDWNDVGGSQVIVFGYRYNEVTSPTTEDLLIDVAGTSGSGLYLRVGTVGAFGLPLYGIGHDADSDGFDLSDSPGFVSGVAVTAPSDSATAADGDDYYAEGWFSNGFWEVFQGEEGVGWSSAFAGISDVSLVDGAWVGLSFAPGYSQSSPSVSLAVPEPGSVLMLLGGALMVAGRRGRKRGAQG